MVVNDQPPDADTRSNAIIRGEVDGISRVNDPGRYRQVPSLIILTWPVVSRLSSDTMSYRSPSILGIGL